jgi:hypothetical protein
MSIASIDIQHSINLTQYMCFVKLCCEWPWWRAQSPKQGLNTNGRVDSKTVKTFSMLPQTCGLSARRLPTLFSLIRRHVKRSSYLLWNSLCYVILLCTIQFFYVLTWPNFFECCTCRLDKKPHVRPVATEMLHAKTMVFRIAAQKSFGTTARVPHTSGSSKTPQKQNSIVKVAMKP